MHGAHDGVAACRDTGGEQRPEERDALIAQRITLVDADDGRWQSCDIVGAGEDRPRQRILRVGRRDAIGVPAPLPQHPQEVPVELNRRRERLAISIERDVRAQRVEPGDQIDVALAEQPHPGGQREIPATALTGDHDAVRIDAERLGVGVDPPNRRNTIVQTGRELADLPRRRRHDRIAEVDGDNDRSLTGHHPVEGSIVAVERRQIRHAATMEIDHPRRRRRPIGPGHVARDDVAVRRRLERERLRRRTGKRHDLLGIDRFSSGLHELPTGDRLRRVRQGQRLLTARDRRNGLFGAQQREDLRDPRDEPAVGGEIRHRHAADCSPGLSTTISRSRPAVRAHRPRMWSGGSPA